MGRYIRVPIGIQKEIKSNFDELIRLKRRGINLFFTDIDRITEVMYQEKDKVKN